MTDPCVPKKVSFLREIIAAELAELEDIPLQCWLRLSTIVDMDASGLQHAVLASARVAAAYFEKKTLIPASSQIFGLLEGDFESHVQTFMEGPPPPEPGLLTQLYVLWHGGYNRHSILQALNLLSQCPWSTLLVEQMHASCSLVRRHHPEYGRAMLQMKAFAYTISKLLPSRSDLEHCLDRAAAKLDKLLLRQPQKITGRQAYLQEALRRSSPKLATGTASFSRRRVQQRVMASHGSWYARLGCDVHAHYEDVAAELHSKRVDELAVQVSDQVMLIQALRREVDHQEHSSTIPAFSKCKLDPHSIARCLAHVQAVSQSSGLKVLRRQSESCPSPTPGDTFAMLTAAGVEVLPSVHEHIPLPDWAKLFVPHRNELRDVVLVISSDEHQSFFKLAYIVANPPAVVFWPLLDVSDDDKQASFLNLGHADDEPLMSRFVWKYQPGPPMQSWELEVQHCFMSICPKVQLHGAHLLGSDLDFESCTTFFEMLGRGPCHQGSASSGSGQQGELAERPWLASLLGSTSVTGSATKSPSMTSTSPSMTSTELSEQLADEDAGPDEEVVTHGDQIRVLFDELAEKQKELKAVNPKEDKDFQITFVGETRSMRKKSAAVAGVKAGLRVGSAAELWAKEFKLQTGARFEISAYGEAWAMRLARAWLHRMSFLYKLWLTSEDPAGPCSKTSMDAYAPSEDLELCLSDLHGPGLKRAKAILSLAPAATASVSSSS